MPDLQYLCVGDVACAYVDSTLHAELNAMADMFSQCQGLISRPDFDYHAGGHPAERQAFGRALIVYCYLTEVQPDWTSDDEILAIDDIQTDSILYAQLNEIASNFYRAQGYIEREDFDFHTSPHPGEQSEFVMAYNAYHYIAKNDLDWGN